MPRHPVWKVWHWWYWVIHSGTGDTGKLCRCRIITSSSTAIIARAKVKKLQDNQAHALWSSVIIATYWFFVGCCLFFFCMRRNSFGVSWIWWIPGGGGGGGDLTDWKISTFNIRLQYPSLLLNGSEAVIAFCFYLQILCRWCFEMQFTQQSDETISTKNWLKVLALLKHQNSHITIFNTFTAKRREVLVSTSTTTKRFP